MGVEAQIRGKLKQVYLLPGVLKNGGPCIILKGDAKNVLATWSDPNLDSRTVTCLAIVVGKSQL